MGTPRTVSKVFFLAAVVCAVIAFSDYLKSANGVVPKQRAGPGPEAVDGREPFGPGHHPKIGEWNKEQDSERRKELFKEWKANDPKDTGYLAKQPQQAASSRSAGGVGRDRVNVNLLSGVMGRA